MKKQLYQLFILLMWLPLFAAAATTDTIPTRDNNAGMGNPSNATAAIGNLNNYLIVKPQFTLSYNNSKGMANWVSWHLSTAWKGSATRCDCFTQDATLPTGYYRASTANYTATGFDRGHICPSDDRDGSDTDNAATFKMTNISPQAPILNQQTWGDLEDYCRTLANQGKELYIIAGGYGTGGSGSNGGTTASIDGSNINVPSHFWKVIVVLPVGINDVSRVTTSTQVIAVDMPNNQSVNSHHWEYYRTSIDNIEALTGYDFLSNVDTTIQHVIEARVDSTPTTLIAWNSYGSSNAATLAPANATDNLDTLSGLSAISRGTTASASTGANSFRTTGFQNNGIATTNNDYFQVKLKAKTGYMLSLTGLNARYAGTTSFCTSPGVNAQFAYSLDGTAFTLIGSPFATIGTPAVMSTIDISGISALQHVDAATTIYLRYYASGQTNSGSWGFYSPSATDNALSIAGSVTPTGCVGAPTAGAAYASANSICVGSNSDISLPTATTGTGISYQWQSSNTGTTGSYTLIAGATNAGYTATPAVGATYYRSIVTCNNIMLSDTSMAVTVTTNVASTGTISGSPTVVAGAYTVLSASIAGGTWSSSDSFIATIDSTGAVTGIAPNVATISYTVTNMCGTAVATTNVTVTTGAGVITGGNRAICLTEGGLLLTDPIAGGVWSSSNTSVATVDSTGTVMAITVGVVTITYTAGGGSATTTITINGLPSAGTITGIATVCTGTATTLSNAVSGGTWTSSNTSVASVGTSGIVTGIASGTASITYTVSNSCGSASSVVVVTVNPLPNIITGTKSVCIGGTTALGNIVPGGTWSSSNTAIATIGSASGVVTGIAAGTAVISYTLTSGCGAATAIVTVNAPFASGGIITTIAGTGNSAYNSDGIAATSAWVNWPYDIAIDNLGNIFIADDRNNRIRKISPSGIITTLAGNGSYGFAGDGGLATAAVLSEPMGIIVDKNGNIYFADLNNNRIRKISSTGIITTVAGTGTAGYNGDGGMATAASLNSTYSMAVDTAGNLYIADNNNYRIRKVSTSGIITTFAGTGTNGNSGNNGAATSANMHPFNIAADGLGNLYFSDGEHHCVRKISATGIVTLVAGNGTPGSAGDGGAATAAQLNSPQGMAIDASGNLYIANYGSSTVRKVNTSGIISTIAGTGTSGYNGDGGAATGAQLNQCTGVDVDALGNIYIADSRNHRVRKISGSTVSVSGTLSVCAGATTSLSSTTGGGTWSSSNTSVATVGTSGLVTGIGSGTAKITYLVSNSCGSAGGVVVVTVNPLPDTITGTKYVCTGGTTALSNSAPGGTWSSNNAKAIIGAANGIVTGIAAGTTVITYTTASCGAATTIVTINQTLSPAGIITTIAGTGNSAYNSDGIAATSAWVNWPYDIAFDNLGNIYIADDRNNRIRKISPSGIITTLAGNGSYGFAGDGGPATAAVLSEPMGIIVDKNGNIYFADLNNNRIRKISSTGIITTVAGTGTAGYNGDGGMATAASLNSTYSMAVDTAGNLYIADNNNYRIRKVSTSGIITTFAGTGTNGNNGDNGAATSATMHPFNIAADGLGNLYFSDGEHHCVRKISATGIVTLVAGNGTPGSAGDGGVATAAQLNSPQGMAIDASGNLYIANYGSSTVRKVNTSGIISTIAGTGTSGYNGDGGAATSAQLNQCTGVDVDALGNIYIADSRNHRVRKISGSVVSIFGTLSVCAGATTSLSSTTAGGTWISSNTSVATVGTSGVVTGMGSGTAKITYYVSTICGSTSSEVVVTVNPVLPITGTPTVCPGATTSLSNATSGGNWSSSNTAVATVGAANGVVNGLVAGTTTISYVTPTGCVSILTVTVNNTAIAPITGITDVCAGSITTLNCTTTAGYWYSTDSTVATVSASGVVTGVTTGTVSIVYAVTGTCGIELASVFVSVNSPTPITGSATLCAGAETSLSNVSTGGIWSSGDTSVAIVDSTGAVTGIAPGAATITYTLPCGIATKTITVNPLPDAGYITGPSVVTTGSSITLYDAAGGAGIWSATNSNAIVTPASPGMAIITGVLAGIDTVKYSVTNSCGSANASKIITINSSLGANAGTQTVCAGRTTTLSNATAGGVWSSDAPGIATVAAGTGVVTGNAAGTATISYTVSGASVTSVVTVNPLPAAITGTAVVCENALTNLNNASTGGTWSSDNTMVASISSTGIVTGIASGVTVVSYTLGTGCARTLAITVNAAPPSITGALSACVGNVTTLANTMAGGTWSSSYTSTISVGAASGIITSLTAGSAVVTYTLPTGCKTSTGFTVNATPAAISGVTKACIGTSTTLGNATAGGSWLTLNTDVAAIDAATGLVTGLAAGTALITYTSGTGCTRTTIVTINPLPAAITGPTVVCSGRTITLSDTTAGGLSWTSSNAAVATVNSLSGVVTGVSAGTAIITYTLNTGCIATTTITVTNLPASITGTLKTCVGATTSLANAVSGGIWSSSNVAVGTASAGGAVTGIANGTTTISYTVGGGCTSTTVVTVNISPAISGTLAACTSTTTALSATGGSGAWTSSNSAVGTVTSVTGQVTALTPGTTTISYTLSTGCSANVVVTVTSTITPSTGPSSICMGSTGTLSNTTTGGTWASSNPGIATVGTSNGVVTSLYSTGTVNITYALGASGCKTVKAITINAVPTAITGTLNVCTGAVTTLSSSSGGTWSSNNMTVGTIGSISVVSGRFAALSAGTATVSYTLSNGCAKSAIVTVNTSPSAGTITSSGGFVINTATPPTSVMLSSTGDAGGTWTSNNTAVATIGPATGVVNAAGAGTATISYTVTAGTCTARATHTVNVVAARPVINTATAFAKDDVSIYPNPNNGGFVIKGTIATEQNGPAAITITDIAGQIVYSNKIVVAAGTINEAIQLNKTLASGMYLLTLYTGNDTKVFHFVIQQ